MTILISFSIGFVVGMLSAYLHELYLADKHDQKVAEMSRKYEEDEEDIALRRETDDLKRRAKIWIEKNSVK